MVARSRRQHQRRRQRQQCVRKGGKQLGHGSYGSFYGNPLVPCTAAGETWELAARDNGNGVKVFTQEKDVKKEVSILQDLAAAFTRAKAAYYSSTTTNPSIVDDYFWREKDLSYYFSAPSEYTIGEDQTSICLQNKQDLIDSRTTTDALLISDDDIPHMDDDRIDQLFMIKYKRANGNGEILQRLPLTEDPVAALNSWATQLVNACMVMGYCNFGHMDIKLANILVYYSHSIGKRTKLRLADFGLSASFEFSDKPANDFPFAPFYAIYPTHYMFLITLAQFMPDLDKMVEIMKERNRFKEFDAGTPTGHIQLIKIENAVAKYLFYSGAPEDVQKNIDLKQTSWNGFIEYYNGLSSESDFKSKLRALYEHVVVETHRDVQTWLETNPSERNIKMFKTIFKTTYGFVRREIEFFVGNSNTGITWMEADYLRSYLQQRVDMFSLAYTLAELVDQVSRRHSSLMSNLEWRGNFYVQWIAPLVVSPPDELIRGYSSHLKQMRDKTQGLLEKPLQRPLMHFLMLRGYFPAHELSEPIAQRKKEVALPKIAIASQQVSSSILPQNAYPLHRQEKKGKEEEEKKHLVSKPPTNSRPSTTRASRPGTTYRHRRPQTPRYANESHRGGRTLRRGGRKTK